MFKSVELKALSPEDAREAIGAPARSRGVLIDDDALDLIHAMSGCYPFFLQKYAHEVWKLAEDNRITRVDAQNAQPIVQTDLDEGFFAIRISIATPAERDYMVALAGLGGGPQNVTTIAKRAGYRDANSAAPHRDALLKKGLIWAPARGTLDFTAPLVGDYLRRRYLT